MSIQQKLVKHADKVAKAADFIAQQTSDWQLIRAYMSNRVNDIELNERQENKLKRYKFVYDQLASGRYTQAEVLNQLMNEKLYGVSFKQAHEDIKCATELFYHTLSVNKIFEINLELQIARNMMRKAEDAGDLKTVALFQKNRANLLKLLPEEEDTSAELFEGHTLEAVFDPRLLGAPDVDMKEVLRVINDKRKVKINIDSFAVDIPHEDLSDEETAPL